MTKLTKHQEREMDFHLILLPIVSRQIHHIDTHYSLILRLHDSLHLTAVLHHLDACYLPLNLHQNLDRKI